MARTVVLAVLDSLRYDVFKNYIENNKNSFLSNLMSESVSFNGATATAPWSLPSCASIFTGLDPEEHGALRARTKIAPDINTVLDQFPEEIKTGCFTGNAFITPEYGFSGWDKQKFFGNGEPFPSAFSEYDRSDMNLLRAIADISTSEQPFKQFINSAYRVIYQTRFEKLFDDGGKKITADAISWLKSLSHNQPAFLFLNYLETHDRHKYLTYRSKNIIEYKKQSSINKTVGPDYYFNKNKIQDSQRDHVKELMIDELRYVEDLLSSIWDTLDYQDRLNDTMFIICADHGDGLGEQGIAYHLVGVTEPILRVPMMIYTSESNQDVITKRVSLSWLRDTMLNWFDENSNIDLLDQNTYPKYVSAVNTQRIKDIADGRDIRSEHLINRRAVYESDDPSKKYCRIGSEDILREIEPSGLFEDQLRKGGTQQLDEYLSAIDVKSNQEQAEMSNRTRSVLKDLGYL